MSKQSGKTAEQLGVATPAFILAMNDAEYKAFVEQGKLSDRIKKIRDEKKKVSKMAEEVLSSVAAPTEEAS